MRKIKFQLVVAMLSLVSVSAFAQNEIAIAPEVVEITRKEIVAIPVNELPEAIIAVVTSNFTEHTTAKAFKSLKEKNEFYLVEYTKENIEIKVLFDTNGKIIEQKNTIL